MSLPGAATPRALLPPRDLDYVARRFRDRPDAAYHLWLRVNWQRFMLRSPERRRAMLTLLARYSAEFDIGVIAWVLMENHLHLVVQTPAEESFRRLTTQVTRCRHRRPWPRGHLKRTVLSQFMHQFSRSVSAIVLQPLELKGRLWESPYDLRPVRDRTDLVYCVTYLHANPLEPRLARCAEDYEWSSARSWVRPHEAPVPLIGEERLPFDFAWSELRARVQQRAAEGKFRRVWSELASFGFSKRATAKRQEYLERLRAAGLSEEPDCGSTAADQQP